MTLDQNGCVYVPHVQGIMVGQPYQILNSDGVLHNVHSLPKVNPPVQQADAADAEGDDDDVRQAGTGLPDQVRRAPVDERLHRRLHASVLLGNEDGREVHDLGSRPGDLRDHGLARGLGTQTASITVGANETKSQNFKFTVTAK